MKNVNVIAMMNHKGGCGKTTTAKSIAYELAANDKRVVLIDLDPQCNTSKGLLSTLNSNNVNALNILEGNVNMKAPIDTGFGFDLIQGHEQIGNIDQFDLNKNHLKEAINMMRTCYDYILIDNSPFFNQLTAAVVQCSDLIIIPSILENDSLDGVLTTIKEIKNINDNIAFKILVTQVNQLQSTKNDLKIIYDIFKPNIYKTYIRNHNYALKRARAKCTPVGSAYPAASVSKDYFFLAQEIIKEVK